jgi:hypothetical protein
LSSPVKRIRRTKVQSWCCNNWRVGNTTPQSGSAPVFLEDYDQEIARQLVQSVDVWLNVPRRRKRLREPAERSCHQRRLEFLDPRWLVAGRLRRHERLRDWKRERGDDVAKIDALDAESLYSTLESKVVPVYYSRDESGIPREWIAMMKRAIQTLAPKYNSDRMVEEYARRIYPQITQIR